jgi:hypothetical protein
VPDLDLDLEQVGERSREYLSSYIASLSSEPAPEKRTAAAKRPEKGLKLALCRFHNNYKFASTLEAA